jgi:hypothetical protein
MYCVAPSAEAVALGLKVKAAVKVERWAVLVELGSDSGAVSRHEVHLARA